MQFIGFSNILKHLSNSGIEYKLRDADYNEVSDLKKAFFLEIILGPQKDLQSFYTAAIVVKDSAALERCSVLKSIASQTATLEIPRLWNEVKEGVRIAYRRYGDKLVSIGVDTWGVDFALLDSNGELVGLPYCYRDPRRKEAYEELLKVIPPERIYMRTGIQFMPINPLYQLYAMVKDRSSLIQAARVFLMMPDLFNYWLTGIIACEYTDASTTQFLDPYTKNWAFDLLEEIDFQQIYFRI
uniref:Carbohydrate kinase FGGY N-terminal domain-containing protein n=1 Tax=Ignisphaera aggregans TaxID=334771 RepID=A0A7C5UU53_9CREN